MNGKQYALPEKLKQVHEILSNTKQSWDQKQEAINEIKQKMSEERPGVRNLERAVSTPERNILEALNLEADAQPPESTIQNEQQTPAPS